MRQERGRVSLTGLYALVRGLSEVLAESGDVVGVSPSDSRARAVLRRGLPFQVRYGWLA